MLELSKMTSPIYHGIPTSAYIPILKQHVDLQSTDLYFHDYYPELYQRFGILRDEMIVVMPQVLTVDPLVGTARLKYLEDAPLARVQPTTEA